MAEANVSQKDFDRLRQSINSLDRKIGQLIDTATNGKSANGKFSIPVNWATWFVLSAVMALLLWAATPAFTEQGFGQAFLAVLVATLLTWAVYRAILWLVSLFAGKSLSLFALLPQTFLGWVAVALTVAVLYLGWQSFGPSQSSISETLSSWWDTISEYSPLGALFGNINGNKNSGGQSDVSESASGTNGTSNGPVESGPNVPSEHSSETTPLTYDSIEPTPGRGLIVMDELFDTAERLGIDVKYRIETEGSKTFNKFVGSELLQKRGAKCWMKIPLLVPAHCNPELSCLSGLNPVTGLRQITCPSEVALKMLTN